MTRFERIRKYILVFLSATLSATVVLKVGEIQYLELIYLADLLVLSVLIFREGLQVRIYRPFAEIGKSYAIFLCAAFLLSLFALQQDFATSFTDSTLKKPVLVTLARMFELFLDVFYMLYLAALYREDEALCRFGLKTYYWTGIVGCLYSIFTLPLNVMFRLSLGTYGDIHRFRGFNNEGGGFGLYLLSVFVVAVVLHKRQWLGRPQYIWGMSLILLCLVGSQSKSLFFAAALLGTIEMIWLFRGWKRWSFIGVLLAALFGVASLLNFPALTEAYFRGTDAYQDASALRSDDPNFVMGRVSGAVLGPRMLAARPLLGIGWGNYPLVRDDPEYRQGTAFSLSSTDAPNLGPVDYVIELGIPLWLYLTWLEFMPVIMVRRRTADAWLVSMALMQPLSNWAGAHLNLTHPWVVSGFALGLAYTTGKTASSVTGAMSA